MTSQPAQHELNSRRSELSRIALVRAETICVSRLADSGERDSVRASVAASGELARLGIAVKDPSEIGHPETVAWHDLLGVVRAARGAHRDFAPLFAGFPDRLPSFDDAPLRFALGLSRLVDQLDVDPNDPDIDWDDRWRSAADLSTIGWWPASSVAQDVDASKQAKRAQKLLASDDMGAPWRVRVADASQLLDVLAEWTLAVFASPIPGSDALRADLTFVLDVIGVGHISAEDVPSVEMRALLTSRLWESASRGDEVARRQLLASNLAPDDLLRTFAAVTEGDVSLNAPIVVPKFPRRMRRLVMQIIEQSDRRRDVFRRRNLWLHVFKAVHAGEHKSKTPVSAALAAELRVERYDRTSTRSEFERLLDQGNVIGASSVLAHGAPTVLVRELRRLLALADEADRAELLRLFVRSASGSPLRVLYQLRSQFLDNGATYPRVAFTKRGRPLVIDRDAGHLALAPAIAADAVAACEEAIAATIAEQPETISGPIWVDPVCEALVAPFQQRSGSDSHRTVERGSRIGINAAPVIRLFVHWQEPKGLTSDLDLSVIAFDDNFALAGQVSWTNLTDGAIVHSGDVTSAPDGASEFIDIDIAAAVGRGYRYLAPVVYRYSGPNFADLPEAEVGWMLRTQTSSDRKTFDVATVDDHFRLQSSGGRSMPFVFDAQTNEIIWVDVTAPSHQAAAVENSAGDVSQLARHVAARVRYTPTIAEVVSLYASVRGMDFTHDRATARTTVGTDVDCTYNVFEPAGFGTDFM